MSKFCRPLGSGSNLAIARRLPASEFRGEWRGK
jgi:hypothetical protein